MCIRQTYVSCSAHTSASPGSLRKAVMSFTMTAPRPSALCATSAFAVSMDTGTAPASCSSTGTTRRSSSSSVTPPEPGRVDSPPMSTSAAPSSIIRRAAAAATPGSRCTPPSENESGVTLTTPMTDGRGKRCSIGCTSMQPNRGVKALSAFGWVRRRLHRRAGEREGPRARLRVAARLALRRRLRDRLFLVREDRCLVLALEQTLELVAIDRLALDEDERDLVEVVDVLAERAERELMRLFDHAADLVVDLPRDLLGVVGLGAVVAAEERLVMAAAEHARPELLAHAEAHDHRLRGRRDLLEVVRSAGRDL